MSYFSILQTTVLIILDGTIYTCVFIPSEDGEVTPTQEKYRKQSYQFLNGLVIHQELILVLSIIYDEIKY